MAIGTGDRMAATSPELACFSERFQGTCVQLVKDKAAHDGMTPILIAASRGHEQPLGRRMWN